MENSQINEVQELYQQLINAWNNRTASGMADLFIKDGEIIGFDGSQSIGRDEIFTHLQSVFEHHQTDKFVSKVKNVRFLAPDIAILRAIAGMAPHGQSDLNPDVNTHHTLVAVKTEGKWYIQLFQNTPAQFHGRPEWLNK